MYWRFLNVLMMTLYVEARVLQRKGQKERRGKICKLTRSEKRILGEQASDRRRWRWHYPS